MKLSSLAPRRKNLAALAVCAAALILTLVIVSLPVYTLEVNLLTKKSGNTFVGDERYLAAKETVEAAVAEYEAQGLTVQVDETVTERVNSKGETTSMVAFTVKQSLRRTGWQFLTSGFSSGLVLAALLICVLGAAVCAGLGAWGTLDTPYRALTGRAKILRTAACWLTLLALLLTPLFVMSSNVVFGRKLDLIAGDLTVANADALLVRANDFLFDGAMGDSVKTLVGGLAYQATASWWLLAPVLFLALLAAVMLLKGSLGQTLGRGLMIAFVVVLCVVTLYPYYVMFITSFRADAETTDMYFQNLFPTEWKWENMAAIMERGVPRYLLNSLVIAVGSTALTLLCGVPAAYAMARMRFRGRSAFMAFIIMSQMFSPVVLLVGIAKLMSILGLNDTLLGLILINAAFNQAFAVWLLRGTFVAISPEMEQAASIDGCSTVGALMRVLLPMAAPGIVTALIFVFINAWNEYTISTVLISTAANRPITVGITQFSSYTMIQWNYLFASSLLATIPVVVLFMCIEKHLVAGLTAGGVKG